jgi:FkbH-like protein
MLAVNDRVSIDCQPIKCVVWDLDDTLWQGTLSESTGVLLRDDAVAAVQELDRRGILQSIASRNNFPDAIRQIELTGLGEYFLYPQIGWGTKSGSIAQIAQLLNIGLDSMALVDDQAFEREEVRYTHPAVACFDAGNLREILLDTRLNPVAVTKEARSRRSFYLAEMRRQKHEEQFDGATEEFLASLDMKVEIARASAADLERAAELTVRTHQLNTTGQAFSVDELHGFCYSPSHLLCVTRLTDIFGEYGTIGLTLAQVHDGCLCLKVFLISCRVSSRGIGTIVLLYFAKLAKQLGLRLTAEFIPNGRNRAMYVAFRFAGFEEQGARGELVLLEHDLQKIPDYPGYLSVAAPQVAL